MLDAPSPSQPAGDLRAENSRLRHDLFQLRDLCRHFGVSETELMSSRISQAISAEKHVPTRTQCSRSATKSAASRLEWILSQTATSKERRRGQAEPKEEEKLADFLERSYQKSRAGHVRQGTCSGFRTEEEIPQGRDSETDGLGRALQEARAELAAPISKTGSRKACMGGTMQMGREKRPAWKR